MSKIKVDKDQFAYVVFSYLFDKLMNMDEVSAGNEDFNKIMKKLKPKLFPLLREIYLKQPADLRMKYKIINKAFRPGSSQQMSIFVVPSDKTKEVEPSLLKKIIKKVIKAITSSTEISSTEVDYIKEILEEDVKEED